MSGGRAKVNISASRFLWVDLDCKDYPGREEQQRDTILGLLSEDKLRPAGIPKPTAFWFTGGGYQAIWRMAEPVPQRKPRLTTALCLSRVPRRSWSDRRQPASQIARNRQLAER